MLDLYPWSDLWVICDSPSTNVPRSLRALISSQSPEDAEKAYEELNIFVVVQGSVFSSAVACVDVLLAALGGTVSGAACEKIFELLWMISEGNTDDEERARGHYNCAEGADSAISRGFWLLVTFLDSPNPIVRKYCLELVGSSRNAKKRRVDSVYRRPFRL